jgi:FtsZ-interacting cell division protein YlmF
VKEFFIFIDEDATEAQIKEIAAEIFLMSPLVVGVYRPAQGACIEDKITHSAPGATQ